MHVAQLGDGRSHHAGQPVANLPDFVVRPGEQAILQLAQRERGDRCEGLEIDVVIDPHHAVDAPAIVGQRMLVEMLERLFREGRSSRLAHIFAVGRQSRLPIAGLAVVGRPQQPLEAGERHLAFEDPRRVNLVRLGIGHADFVERRQFAHAVTIPFNSACNQFIP